MNSYEVSERINTDVNSSVRYVSDAENYGQEEYWTEGISTGDCEDIALAKRARLVEMGWGLDDLCLCLCTTEMSEGHCVLWVNTDKGGFILDNRHPFPRTPSQLPYTWHSIMRGGKWYELSGWE